MRRSSQPRPMARYKGSHSLPNLAALRLHHAHLQQEWDREVPGRATIGVNWRLYNSTNILGSCRKMGHGKDFRNMFGTNETHQDFAFTSGGATVQFIWNPWLNSTKLEQEHSAYSTGSLLGSAANDTPATSILVGVLGLYYARFGREKSTLRSTWKPSTELLYTWITRAQRWRAQSVANNLPQISFFSHLFKFWRTTCCRLIEKLRSLQPSLTCMEVLEEDLRWRWLALSVVLWLANVTHW